MVIFGGCTKVSDETHVDQFRFVAETLAPYGMVDDWGGQLGPLAARLSASRSQSIDGPQLARSADGTIIAAVDASLVDRDSLARRLGFSHSAHTSDAELVVAGFLRWGRDLPEHLRGQFAIAIADRRRAGLFLARDHAGSRFLAYHHDDSGFAFATTSLALTGLEGVGHELDLARAAEMLLMATSTSRTFVKDVRSMLPGSALWFDSKGLQTWRWWRPEDVEIVDRRSMRAEAEALRSALEVAVDRCLEGAEQPGALLSGGLDSTSVVSLAARKIGSRPLFSYTVVPPAGWEGTTERGWISSDQSAVKALCDRYPNVHPKFVDTVGARIFGDHRPLWELGAGPVLNPLNLSWFLMFVQDAAAKGVDVMLTGAAGNLAFSADGPKWLAELARRGKFLRLWRELHVYCDRHAIPIRSALRADLLAPISHPLRHALNHHGSRDRLLADWISATAINHDYLKGIDREVALRSVTQASVDPRNPERMFWLLAGQAEFGTALRGRWGIEERDPTADRDVVEESLTQPEWWRRHAGINRAICRAAMRDVLPTEVVDRTTLGSQLPDWFDRLVEAWPSLAGELEEMRDHPASREVIDVPKLAALVRDWPARESMTDWRVIYGYKLALTRAIHVSQYLRWFEGRAKRVASGGARVIIPAES